MDLTNSRSARLGAVLALWDSFMERTDGDTRGYITTESEEDDAWTRSRAMYDETRQNEGTAVLPLDPMMDVSFDYGPCMGTLDVYWVGFQMVLGHEDAGIVHSMKVSDDIMTIRYGQDAIIMLPIDDPVRFSMAYEEWRSKDVFDAVLSADRVVEWAGVNLQYKDEDVPCPGTSSGGFLRLPYSMSSPFPFSKTPKGAFRWKFNGMYYRMEDISEITGYSIGTIRSRLRTDGVRDEADPACVDNAVDDSRWGNSSRDPEWRSNLLYEDFKSHRKVQW